MSNEPERVLWRAVLARAVQDLVLQGELALEDDLATQAWFDPSNEDYHNVLCLAGVSEFMVETLVKDTLKHRDQARLERLLVLAELVSEGDIPTT